MKRYKLFKKWKWTFWISTSLLLVPIISVSAVACSNQTSNYSEVIAQAILNKSYTIPTQDNKNIPFSAITVSSPLSNLTVTQALDAQNLENTLIQVQILIQNYASQNFWYPMGGDQWNPANNTNPTITHPVHIYSNKIIVVKLSVNNNPGMINVYINYDNTGSASTPIIVGGFKTN